MLIGIDIGGTSTDGILLYNGNIINSVKYPTDITNLQSSIYNALDELIRGIDKNNINRVVLSTTLVTNLIATKQGDKTALILIPGPGLNYKNMKLFPDTYIIDGATDFRGRILEPLNEKQIKNIAKLIADKGIKKAAVVGKFSPRNNKHELRVKEILTKYYPEMEVFIGFEVSGQLNFLRRATTAYYTAMTQGKWVNFAENIQKTLHQRGIKSPIDILKADGGTMPINISLNYPCETVFSGPAASVMGAMALTMDQQTSVVIDIGGTTTDLALILQGEPLNASKGAEIENRYTSIRSFALRSIPLGGDSVIRWDGSKINIGPDRAGPGACFGGPVATPTDAINVLEKKNLGNPDLSYQALEKISTNANLSVEELAKLIINQFVDEIEKNIEEMFKLWEQEPAYRIYELINKRSVQLERVVGIGAAAEAFIPSLSKKLNCQSHVHTYSPVANALGAAVARPTLSLLLHADTQQKHYHLNIDGIAGKIPSKFSLQNAKDMASKYLQELSRKRGMSQYADQMEFFLEEQFNTINGYSTTGKLFDIGVQITPGVIKEFKEVKHQ